MHTPDRTRYTSFQLSYKLLAVKHLPETDYFWIESPYGVVEKILVCRSEWENHHIELDTPFPISPKSFCRCQNPDCLESDIPPYCYCSEGIPAYDLLWDICINFRQSGKFKFGSSLPNKILQLLNSDKKAEAEELISRHLLK